MTNPIYLEDLLSLLRIPSISALPENKPDIGRAARWVADRIRQAGIPDVEIHTVGDGHPLIFAERVDDSGNPTVLFYGHYDVQPVDPLDEWISPPFEPAIRDGKIYARGASDDKGQLVTHIFGLTEAAKKWPDRWPVNVKFLIEGEEESGGTSLERWAAENQERIKADLVVVSDTAFLKPDLPSMDYGLRGIVYMEIEAVGLSQDLHSGVYGGGVLNPAQALASVLSRLIDAETGRILIPGFYDRVRPITDTDRRLSSEVPFSEEDFLSRAGAARPFGETGYSTYERITSRPSLDINGIWGGFAGDGAKTVIPRRAGAKVSMRIVPDQNPGEIADLFSSHAKKICPRGIEITCRAIHKAEALRLDPDSLAIRMARDVMEEVFGKKPVLTRSGASIPIATVLAARHGLDVVFMGFGLPDDGLHSPNEKFDIPQLDKGIQAIKRLLERVAAEWNTEWNNRVEKA